MRRGACVVYTPYIPKYKQYRFQRMRTEIARKTV